MKDEIDLAFKEVRFPGRKNILIKDYEAHDVTPLDYPKMKEWKPIPEYMLPDRSDAISLLGPLGYQFFIPRYMYYVLVHLDSPDEVSDSTLYSLCPSEEDQKVREWQLDKYKPLTPEQKKAVLSFILFVKDSLIECFEDERMFDQLIRYWTQAVA